jgi:hypothetical protein
VIAFAWEIDKTSYVTSVIDGDSFYITGDEVRLADVSAPEWNEYGGSAATSALKDLISGKTVYLDTDQQSGRDKYGRLIAVVYVKSSSNRYINVNKALLNQGVVSRTDYTNNEFNPSTWTYYVSTSSNLSGSRLSITLIIGFGILVIIYFTRSRKRMKRENRVLGLSKRERNLSWEPITFSDETTRERIQVGSWRSEYVGKSGIKFSFRPRVPLWNRDSRIWRWLRNEIKKYGRSNLLKNGGIDLFIRRNAEYGDLLRQISWAYYTLLAENKHLH